MNDAILRRVIGTTSDHLQIADALLKVSQRPPPNPRLTRVPTKLIMMTSNNE